MFYISNWNWGRRIVVTDTEDNVSVVTNILELAEHCFNTGDYVYGFSYFTKDGVNFEGRISGIIEIDQPFNKDFISVLIKDNDIVKLENYLAESMVGATFTVSIRDIKLFKLVKESYDEWVMKDLRYGKEDKKINHHDLAVILIKIHKNQAYNDKDDIENIALEV